MSRGRNIRSYVAVRGREEARSRVFKKDTIDVFAREDVNIFLTCLLESKRTKSRMIDMKDMERTYSNVWKASKVIKYRFVSRLVVYNVPRNPNGPSLGRKCKKSFANKTAGPTHNM